MNSIDGPFLKSSTLTYRTRRQFRKRLSPFFFPRDAKNDADGDVFGGFLCIYGRNWLNNLSL